MTKRYFTLPDFLWLGISLIFSLSISCLKGNEDEKMRRLMEHAAMDFERHESILNSQREEYKKYYSAAVKGDPDAQYHIGYLHDVGLMELSDEQKAIQWYEKAAAQNHAESQFELGLKYKTANDLTNISKSIYWLQKAGRQGHVLAQYHLGVIYFGETYNQDNPQKAYYWFHQAAESGDSTSQFLVAQMLETGDGVSKDLPQAFQWYLKAANNEDPQAQSTVAYMYANGEGVTKNSMLAYKWYKILFAATQSADVLAVTKSLENTMSDEDVANAQKLADTWIANH